MPTVDELIEKADKLNFLLVLKADVKKLYRRSLDD